MKGGLNEEKGADVYMSPEVAISKLHKEKEIQANAPEAAASPHTGPQKISLIQVICLLVVILLFLLSATGTVIMWGTNMFEAAIDEKLILRNDTESFEKWRRSSVDVLMHFRVFNYTNVEAFENGNETKLHVEEAGPYTFREKSERVNVVFNDNGTLTYQEKKHYDFVPELSNGTLEDQVTAVNMLLAGINYRTRGMNYLQKLALSGALEVLRPEPLFTKTVRELFFGYKDALLTMTKFGVKNVKMGLLESSSGISADTVTVYTGATGLDLMGRVTRYNGFQYVDYYADAQCNRVDGFDGSKFPPSSLYPGATLYVYHRDACRKIPLVYRDSVKVWDEVPALRFSPPEDAFDNGEKVPENECYCHKTYGEECQPSGVADASSCKNGAPIFVSYPHFLHADQKLQQMVGGLRPDPARHMMHIDIHQRLGAPLALKSRFQLNVLMKKVVGPTSMAHFDGLLLPVFWIDRELEEFPEEVRSVIRTVSFTVPVVKSSLSYGCPVVLAVTGLVLLVCMYMEVAALLRTDSSDTAGVAEMTRL